MFCSRGEEQGENFRFQWTKATVCGYADDTSCTDSDKDIDAIKPKCEESVKGLLDYMAVNRLAANDDKTHILVVRCGKNEPDEKLTFQVGEKMIVERAHEKLLGIWVSNDLKWSHHLSVLESKLNHRLFTLRRIEQVVSRSLLKKWLTAYLCQNYAMAWQSSGQ